MFDDIYRKCQRTNSLQGGQEKVAACISTIINKPFLIDNIDLNCFINIPGYKVTIDDKTAFFPKSLAEIEKYTGLNSLRAIFLEVDLVFPPYCQLGHLYKLAADIQKISDIPSREQFINYCLTNTYSEDSLAALCIDVYKKKKSMAPFYDHIIQSMESYFFGLYKAAIITLIPCIEGTIRNIGCQIGMSLSKEIDINAFVKILKRVQTHDIRNIIFQGYDWFPYKIMNISMFDKFNERIQIVESIKYFIKNSMYLHTALYSKPTRLNRHGIVHGFITDFDSSINYLRLITLLNALSLTSIIAGDAGSFFHPPVTHESELLAIHFHKIKLANIAIRS